MQEIEFAYDRRNVNALPYTPCVQKERCVAHCLGNKRKASLLAIILCGIFFVHNQAWGEFIAADAIWRFSEIGSDNTEEQDNISSYSQRYHLQWAPQVSRSIFIDTNMNYSKTWTTGAGSREILSPTANLLLLNDLFRAELNGLVNQTNNTQSSNKTDTTWEGLLSSNWEYQFWPQLSLTVGQNWLSDDESPPILDTDRSWAEFTAEWAYNDFEAYYSYYQQNENDGHQQSSLDETKHFAKFDYQQLFSAGRGQFSLSQQFTSSTTDYTTALGEDGTAYLMISLSQAYAGVDNTPDRGPIPSNSGLIDRNTDAVAYTIVQHQVANLAIKTDFQAIDRLYVYTPELDPLIVSEADKIRWDLYSSEDGNEWELVQNNPSTTYDRDQNRYIISIASLQAIYVKLVITAWPTTMDMPITEIEAFRRESGTGSELVDRQEYTKYLTDFNVRFDPTTNTRLTYSLVWDDSEYNTGNDRNRLFQSASVRWLYNKYFIPTFTINNTDTKNSEIADTTRRSYGLIIQSTPLPTLEGSISLTRNENYEDDTLTDSNHTITLLTSAELYPDLESTLDINIIFNKNEELDTSTEEALGIRWSLTARLRESLVADLIAEYESNTLDLSEVTNEEDSGGRITLNLNWRPSDLVSVIANASQGYGDRWTNYQSFLLDSKFAVLRTRKTQLILGYRVSSTSDETLQDFNYNWSWNISPYLTFQSLANYILSEDENVWTVSARLTARF